MSNEIVKLSTKKSPSIVITEYSQLCKLYVVYYTRSQAVARIADRTASQQTLVIRDALPMKLHAVNSTSFRLLYRSTIRINTAPLQSLKNLTLSPFRKLVRPVVPSDIPGDQYFEYVTANSIFILFLHLLLTCVVIK